MKWCKFLLILQVGITCAKGNNDVSINHGTLIQNMGQITLIENVVIIKKNLTELRNVPNLAQNMTKLVEKLMASEKDEENNQLLKEAKDKLMDLTGSREKRSLLPFVGSIMNQLFGVATEASVEKERERLDKIEAWAQEYGHVINNVIDNLNDHAKSFNILSDELMELENKVENEMNRLERKLKVQQVVNKINVKIKDILDIMESVRLAHFGKADVNLITVAELKEIIHYSIIKFQFQPLEIDIVTYYSMLNVKVVENMCYILLPFNNDEVFTLKKIIPFPMTINENDVMLSGKVKLVLESKLNDLINVWEEQNLDNCLEWKERKYICNIPNFFLQPIDIHKCIKFLLQGGEDNCIYQHVEENFHVFFLNDVYIFTKERQMAEVSCKGNEIKMEIINVKVIQGNCKIKIPGYFFYKPTVFKSVNLNTTEKRVQIEGKLKEFKISHHQIKMKTMPPYENRIMLMYKQSVMPWLPIITIPFLIILGLICYCAVRVLILKRIDLVNSMLGNVIGKQNE